MNKGQEGLYPRHFNKCDFRLGNLVGKRQGTKHADMLMSSPLLQLDKWSRIARITVHGATAPSTYEVKVVLPDEATEVDATKAVSLKQARFLLWRYAEQLSVELRYGAKDTAKTRIVAMYHSLNQTNMPISEALRNAYNAVKEKPGNPDQGNTTNGGEADIEALVQQVTNMGSMDEIAAAFNAQASQAAAITPEQEQAQHDEAVLKVLKDQTPLLCCWLDKAIEADRKAAAAGGFPQHSAFDALKKRVALGGVRNYLLVGPAGSGKTTLARNLADDLGLPFGIMSITAGVTESHLLGRILPPKYELVPSPFVRIYSEGGVFLLDEVDAADPNVLLTVNSALANGLLVTPDGNTWRRHPDTYILAAANTWGKGAERGYSGRNALDRSTRDRFTLKAFEMNYCPTMEAGIARGRLADRLGDRLAVLATTMALRHAAESKRIEETVSARFVEEASTFMANGASLKFCLDELLTPWSLTDREKVKSITDQVTPFVKVCRRMAERLEVA